MMKIAICDDNQNARETLYDLIKKSEVLKWSQLELAVFEKGTPLFEEIAKGTHFDIIFLDIDMPNMSGIEVGKLIRKYDSRVKIVYVTNYSDYQNRAFEVHAFGYLTKPLRPEALDNVMSDAIQYLKEDDSRRAAQIIFKTDDGSFAFRYTDIYYIESVGHKIRLYTVQGEYLVSKSLTEVNKEVERHNFCMCHKSYIVNLVFVRRIVKFDAELLNEKLIPIAQKKLVSFKKAFNNYLQTTNT